MTIYKVCKKCHKYHNQTILKDCRLCKDLAFAEHILCDLTRGGQQGSSLFECGAFKPLLSLVDKNNISNKPQRNLSNIDNTIVSDKVRWFQAYAKQQLQLNPDQIFYKIKYHVCLSTRKRKKIFSDNDKHIGEMTDVLKSIGFIFEETVQIFLLWLASDHIHLNIYSNPDYSIDEIVNKTKEITENEILNSFLKLTNKLTLSGRETILLKLLVS